ncbi:hypothetical protein P3L10_001713 [Capsicum annuum]
MQFFNFFSIFLFVSFFILLIKWKNSNSKTKRLPPGPWKLPLLGSNFHFLGGLTHRVLRDLAKKYGPIIHLQLGEVSLVVVTSPDMAKQVLKTHDIAFASRPVLVAAKIVCYNGSDIAFSPYGYYWRQMRKICILKLLSVKNVKSEFGKVFKEQDELILLVKKLSRLMEGFDVTDIFPSLKLLHVLCGMKGRIMDVHHELDAIFENIINENKNNGELEGEGFVAALVRLMKEGGLQFPITNDNIKAIILDIFSAGTETSSATIDWIMVEMMRNPNMLSKAQTEVRNTFRGKESFDENDVEEFKYLKLVIKESFRLHPPFPLLLPRECREETDINGYTIPRKTKVMVNAWAIGRDSKYWNDAESFKHERFEHNSMDFIDNNFEYLPFGSGRRMCPGISFGLANICFPLTQLLYHFDWKLPNRISPNNLDLTESIGASCARKNNLYLIMVPYQPCQE